MRLSTKLAGSLGTMIVLILILGGISLYEMSHIEYQVNELAENWMPSIVAVGNVQKTVNVFRRYELAHILTKDEKLMERYATTMKDTMAQLQEYMKEYEKLISSSEEASVYEEYKKDLNHYLTVHDMLISLSEMNENEKAADMAAGPSFEALGALLAKIDTLVAINQKGGREGGKQAAKAHDDAVLMVNTVMVIAVLVGIILSVLIVRGVMRQLGEDPGYLHRVATDIAAGNLDTQLKAVRGDGGVYGVFVKMIANLKDKIAEAQHMSAEAAKEAETARELAKEASAAKALAERAKAEGMLHAASQLDGIVEAVTSASEELSAQIEQSSRGSEEQSSRVGETATAMDEMNATVLEVAKNAGMAAQTADEAKLKAEEGSGVVAQVIQGIEVVRDQSLEIKADMGTLGQQAEGIGQIMNVISDIADQTNLLALNAAIEAARAGDAGRGFAVVADEVRKLAEKTMSATKEVGDAIRGIQDGTRKNIGNVERAGKTIEEATHLAAKSGEALKKIVELVERTTDQARSIATASEEQSAASDEITRSIEDISRISSENAEAMQQSSLAVGELAQQSLVLKRLIEQMKSESA